MYIHIMFFIKYKIYLTFLYVRVYGLNFLFVSVENLCCRRLFYFIVIDRRGR